MANRVLESEYDKVGDFYYEFVHRRDPTKHPTVEAILSMIGDPTGIRFCDLACGDGFFSRLLAARGAQVTGIDVSENLLRHAQRQAAGLPITYLRDDAQELTSVADGSFDVVICNMALMDIADLTATCRTAHRILCEKGMFLFSILHPCFETPFNAKNPSTEQDEDGNFIAKRVTRYSQEGKWFSDGSGMCGTLGSVHRKLSTYVNTLIRAGFTIQEFAEPLLPPGDYQIFDEQWQSTVPRFLVAKTAKAA
ncbi:methyltransferase domain-containing protein [Chloroflexi bacterium TSY]|nr:methyltransferase domain-containing protein [Chloroflexi bacterium TSY]